MSGKNSTIHEKIAELEALVSWFDSEDFQLEKALEQFETAQKLATSIEAELANFKNSITVINKDFSES